MHDLRELKKEGEVGEDDERRAESDAAEADRRGDRRDRRRCSRARKKRSSRFDRARWRSPIDDVRDPKYVAIITDGNGRWAQQRGLPAVEGHRAGADMVKARLRDAVELGIEELTVFSFSTENWSRPTEEVDGLMRMFGERIDTETPELHEEGVRMRFIGRREGVDAGAGRADGVGGGPDRRTTIGSRFFVAFNYGGRAEIVDAARRFEGSTEEEFRRHLYAPEMHDPDLLIRTSGEQRVSNYLLWQCAYSELVFRDELWPDFDRAAFEESLEEFETRQRRFGARA